MTPAVSAPFRYYLRVRYQECDSQNIVFNARYSDYVDLAVTEFLALVFPGRDPFDGSFETHVVRQLIEWKAPARFRDALEISVWVGRSGTTSFTLTCAMRRAGEDAVSVTAETVYVMVDNKTWAKRQLSDAERAALERGAPGKTVDHAGYLKR